MGELILRAATPADAEPLARLGRDSFVAKFGTLYQPDDLAGFLEATHSPAAVGAAIADSATLYRLALRDGAMVGYCKLSLACGWPEHARGSHAIELKQLYTAPGLTGGGIGAALMEWALVEAAARGADELQLSVYADNPGAQKFYARYGCEKIADIHFMVGAQRDDEFLFAKLI